MARNLMACADPIMAEKQAPFDIEAQRPNDFVQYQKEENQAAVLKQFKACRLGLPKSAIILRLILLTTSKFMPLNAPLSEQNFSMI